jgi:hypothetical protein
MMRMLWVMAAVVISIQPIGCSLVTNTDLGFLSHHDSGPADGAPECIDDGEESYQACHDQCDNDEDGQTDCADSDCVYFCCTVAEGEWLACNDQCDNDGDNLIDCDDEDCAQSPDCQSPRATESGCWGTDQDPACCDNENNQPDGNIFGPGDCCSNGRDDDNDGATDCGDDDCQTSVACCPVTERHQGAVDQQFGPSWQPFGATSGELTWDDGWLRHWGDRLQGVGSTEPWDLVFGLTLSLQFALTDQQECYGAPWNCDALAGIAFGPAATSSAAELAAANLAIVVTGANQVAVLRQGTVEHLIGVGPDTGQTFPHQVRLTLHLVPTTDEQGNKGLRLVLVVPQGRRVCQDASSSVGCPLERQWHSERPLLRLDQGEHVTDEGKRGQHLLVFGRGALHLREDFVIMKRSCANPAGWVAAHDDRLDESSICWALGAIGSPSVARLSDNRVAMVVEGTTRLVPLGGYGINNFSLGWLENVNDSTLQLWRPREGYPGALDFRFRPIDTDYDVNCVDDFSWTALCADDAAENGYEAPAAPPGGCTTAPSRRAPHLIPSPQGLHRMLYAQAIEGDRNHRQLRAASFAPYPSPTWTDLDHVVTPAVASKAIGRTYRSLRDPVTQCLTTNPGDDICTEGRYQVLFVAERDPAGVGTPTNDDGVIGDDVLYGEYDWSGFGDFVALAIDGTAPSSPLAGRTLREPWLRLTSTGAYELWITSETADSPPQVDLLTTTPTNGDHPLATPPWTVVPGSPVVTAEILEAIWPQSSARDIDCSGSCTINGLSALAVHDEPSNQSWLHLWLGITEHSANGQRPLSHISHLKQPLRD